MGTKNNPGAFDCYTKAKPDEPMFVLLGRDQSAALLVRLWALTRHGRIEGGFRPPSDAMKVAEALKCADAMDEHCRKVGRFPHHHEKLLIAVTKGLKQHPDEYAHACACQSCLTYAGAARAFHAIPGCSPQPNHFDCHDEGAGP
jgi:hypothetical protein